MRKSNTFWKGKFLLEIFRNDKTLVRFFISDYKKINKLSNFQHALRTCFILFVVSTCFMYHCRLFCALGVVHKSCFFPFEGSEPSLPHCNAKTVYLTPLQITLPGNLIWSNPYLRFVRRPIKRVKFLAQNKSWNTKNGSLCLSVLFLIKHILFLPQLPPFFKFVSYPNRHFTVRCKMYLKKISRKMYTVNCTLYKHTCPCKDILTFLLWHQLGFF